MEKKAEPKKKKRHRIKRKFKVIFILAIVLAVLLIFIFAFKLDYIVVTGNDRYSDRQIKEMCINEDGFNNTLLFYLFNKKIDTSEVPLLDRIETEYIDNHTIRLKAYEKVTIGMIQTGELYSCIDQDGIVIEVVDADAAMRLSLPVINSLTANGEQGERIEAEESVLNTLHALKSCYDKYGITPDSEDILTDEAGVHTFVLHFGNVNVQLGEDTLLEEKMRRVAAIIPQLEGRSGTLLMDDYSEETVNIIFKEE